MREEFAGKTGLIIGGSSGIGKTVSRLLIERGAEAVIIVGKNKQKLRYLDIITGYAADRKWNLGCLIGDFSLETTSHSELLRLRLEAIFQEWRTPFAACIAEAQAIGEIESTFDPTELAEFLLASWEGAILRMKVERSRAALERFKTIAFQTVFKELK